MKKKPTTIAALGALTAVMLLSTLSVHAGELRFSRHLGDGMVLQRDKPLTISGLADKGAQVTIAFAGQEKSAKAGDGGTWSVTLDAV
ncbi:MAG: hypothetical protein HN919_10035, partial [Verrucomicrobia bacterium]|nr:hypothetical protein [Verrucomicrobiota bacterium]